MKMDENMTAKELKESHLIDAKQGYIVYDGMKLNTNRNWQPHKAVYFETEAEFKTFCTELCKEQREICFMEFVVAKMDEEETAIRDAPVPDL